MDLPATSSMERPLPDAVHGLQMLRERAGWMPLSGAAPQDADPSRSQDAHQTGWIAVTGDDRVRWLNGMVTNSVQALDPGQGAYCFLLNAQGRIQGDGTVWAEADRLLMETDRAQVEPMITLLDRFIIMDDVVLEDVSGQMHGIALAGPAAPEVLRSMGLPEQSGHLNRSAVTWRHVELSLTAAASTVVPRFEVWAGSAANLALFTSALPLTAAVVPVESFELLRILEQRPTFGQDIRDRDLPQETAQDRALHFQKGCYLGQEIVERIRSRGQVHRTFTGFVLQGDVPPAGTEILAEGKPVGLFTTVAPAEIPAEIPAGAGAVPNAEQWALGYLRREAMERGAALTYRFETAGQNGPELRTGTAEARMNRPASKS